MKIIKTICKECNSSFDALVKELDRGNAKFCSRTCVALYTNKNRENYNLICKHCSKSFNSVIKKSKYCSNSCKQKNYRLKSKSNNTKDRTLLKLIREYPCEICNYDKVHRDVHHIIPVSKNGKNEYSNLISLCPNCHREVHSNLISQDDLYKIIKYRTISSSLKTLLKEIKE